MRNNLIFFFLYLLINISTSIKVSSEEVVNFNVSEIEITQDGNIIKGSNGGEVYTNDGISIIADEFIYNKNTTLLVADKNVLFKDDKKKIVIKADNISYIKNQEKTFATGDVIVSDNIKNLTIFANEISYLKREGQILAKDKVILKDKNSNSSISANELLFSQNKDQIEVEGNVKFKDINRNIIIKSEKAIYQKKFEKIFTQGKTFAHIDRDYIFESSDVTFFKNSMMLSSLNKTKIKDKYNALYELDSFEYQIEKEFLKGSNIYIVENIESDLRETNRLFFKDGFFDLKNQKFKTTDTKISLKKDIFDRSENDPRLYGVSSSHENGITSIKKAVFTSCKNDDDQECPPWRLEASEIKHDKNKKQLIYENSILKIYDFPIFYFPKFFHPDPTVKRQSGFLIPKLNNSNILGSSLNVPYFYALSENKDLTFSPTIFSENLHLFQNEYRQENENSSFIGDLGFVNGFKSSTTKIKKNINHIFAKFTKNLKLENFDRSKVNFFLEKVNKDTYLKIFSDNLRDSPIKPKNPDILNSGFDIYLENNQFLLSGGVDIYEDLTKLHSNRYQFVLPYYNFSKSSLNIKNGIFNFNSSGNYILDNTNNSKSRVINDFSFKLNDKIFTNLGLKKNLNFYFKNLNSVGKNVDEYKSSPQIELQSLIELYSELPLLKKTNKNNQTLIPRFSLRLNPSDMKNHANDERRINTSNIFNINRLGIEDSLESGNSLTIGVDYKLENNENNKNIEFKLASVLRDNEENNIPSQTSLNNKNSNIFGSIDYNFSDIIGIDYNFAIDDKIDKFNYNSIGLNLSLNNFVTEFNFIEEYNASNNTNVLENTTQYKFNSRNSISFKTRRNRELNLTEYYNLIYEYKNDCLTAGIRFDKTYYEDRDLKPSENLMFTISFYPLTTIEQSIE